jgi:hypothetical protein
MSTAAHQPTLAAYVRETWWLDEQKCLVPGNGACLWCGCGDGQRVCKVLCRAVLPDPQKLELVHLSVSLVRLAV